MAFGRPRLLDALRHYDRPTAIADVTAGVTVGLVALPLALAFAISSGLTPQAGLYTAVIAGGLISLLGGSRLQIGGPTGAFVVIVAGIAARHGVNGLFICTLMAGAILVVLGATGMLTQDNLRPTTMRLTTADVTDAREPLLNFFLERYAQAYRSEMEAFIDALEAGKPMPTTVRDGVMALRLAECAVESARTGRTVAV